MELPTCPRRRMAVLMLSSLHFIRPACQTAATVVFMVWLIRRWLAPVGIIEEDAAA